MINIKAFVSNLPQLNEDQIKVTMEHLLKQSVTTVEFYRAANESESGKALIKRTFQFDEGESVYFNSSFEIKNSILGEMYECANSFEKCEYFFQNNVPMDEKFRSKVISKMADFAESFEEIIKTLSLDENNPFYEENGLLNKNGEKLLKKALDKAFYIKDFDALENLCSSKNDDLLTKIFKRRQKLYPHEFED